MEYTKEPIKQCTSIEHVLTATSFPEYPQRYSGPCLVAGSAWCAEEDIRKAWEKRPLAPLIAINRTAVHYPALFMVAFDFKNAHGWKADAEKKFGRIELHSGRPKGPGWPAGHPHVDYWWPRLQGGGGTSVWGACKIALALGFNEVVVCGAPLSQGPYLDGEDDWSDRDEKRLSKYRDPWVRDTFMHPYVRAMSGFPKELLGMPK